MQLIMMLYAYIITTIDYNLTSLLDRCVLFQRFITFLLMNKVN